MFDDVIDEPRGRYTMATCWRFLRVPGFALWRGALQCSCVQALPQKFSLQVRSVVAVGSLHKPVHSVCRGFHCTVSARGLEEFFPPEGKVVVEDEERSGRPWLARELRHKSSEDLHKLWYVLLKERNMLLTLRHEAKRAGFIMPAPERLWKVRKSMARIKVVIGERERALKAAKTILKEEELKRKDEEESSQAETVSEDCSEHNQRSIV